VPNDTGFNSPDDVRERQNTHAMPRPGFAQAQGSLVWQGKNTCLRSQFSSSLLLARV